MKGIERRIKQLEEKAGFEKEATVIIISNYAKDNIACKGHKDTGLCHSYNRFKQSPRGMSKSGLIIFRFPCKDCEEATYEP